MGKDIKLDENFEPVIVDGDFVVEDSHDQEVKLLVLLNQGGLKSDPILGPNLVQMMEDEKDLEKLKKRMRLHLERDGKDYEELKDRITIVWWKNLSENM